MVKGLAKTFEIVMYSKEDIETKFDYILSEIKNGRPVVKILKDKGMPCRDTFDKWLNEDKDKIDRYARACETRAELIFDEILDISDHTEEDHTAFTGVNVVQRDRLRIDARKWILEKMNPKKYGTTHQEIKVSNEIPLFPDVHKDDSSQ
jgi:vacuolar-type H+-ATPase subunit I/STV1